MSNKKGFKRKLIKDVVEAPIKLVSEVFEETTDLFKESGELQKGQGLLSGVIALTLAILCFLGVIAFHFPEYLTMPELRQKYSVDLLRQIMFYSMLMSSGIAVYNIVLKRNRNLNIAAFSLIMLTTFLGGSQVPVGDFPGNTPYIGLDWFILDLLGSTMVFILIEKLFPLYKKQAIFRKEWQTDFIHFMVNHFIVGLILLTVNFLIHRVFGWMIRSDFQQFIQNISFIPQLLICILVADFMQYWTHRSYHEVPFLWKFHSVHHSAKTMDWLAGSRQHVLELIFTRVCILGPLYVFGFEKSVMDAYILVVGFQAVFNHSNVHLPWGPLKYFVVTPDFHHWHHSSDEIAIDKNYAAHYSFLDYIFKTNIKVDPKQKFPQSYGVVGDYMPDGFLKQQAFPFKREKK